MYRTILLATLCDAAACAGACEAEAPDAVSLLQLRGQSEAAEANEAYLEDGTSFHPHGWGGGGGGMFGGGPGGGGPGGMPGGPGRGGMHGGPGNGGMHGGPGGGGMHGGPGGGGPAKQGPGKTKPPPRDPAGSSDVQALQGELESTKAELQTAKDEAASASQKLQRTKAELEAATDDANSATEDLRTAMAELASVKAELQAAKEDAASARAEVQELKGQLAATTTTNNPAAAPAADVNTPATPAADVNTPATPAVDVDPPAAPAADDSCQYSKDGACDEPQYCSMGTDCTDCGNCGGGSNSGSSNAATPAPAPPSGGDVTAGSQDEQFLSAHNKYRCMHGVPLLVWDAGIAAKAKEWADRMGGNMKHSSSSFRKQDGCAQYGYCGENLAMGSSITPAEGVQMWYDEIQLTNGGRVSSFASGTGHYTQVVWKETSALGCAVSSQNLQVCMYGKGGNMQGEFTANVNGPVKSESACQSAGGGGGGPAPAPPAASGDNSCRYAYDGACDEPRYCSVGTDCTDCGAC